MELTAEQLQTVHELQQELDELDLKADIEWAKYIHTKDEDCFNEVIALESEREMMGLVAYIPKAGEGKISKIRGLLAKIKGEDGPRLGIHEARIASLDSVNAWRADYLLPPLERLPRGVPGDPQQCTLAVAFRMSMEELGVQVQDIQVSGSADIELTGEGEDGEVWAASPELSGQANALISEFDEHAWLDLLRDDSLRYYADNCWENDDGHRLDEVSAEFKRRGQTYTVGDENYGPRVLGEE